MHFKSSAQLPLLLSLAGVSAAAGAVPLGGVVIGADNASFFQTQAGFDGGVSVSGSAPMTPASFSQSTSVSIDGTIDVGPGHVGSAADIGVLVFYTPPGQSQGSWFVRTPAGYQAYTNPDLTEFPALRSGPLAAQESVNIFTGELAGLPGSYLAFMGYRLPGEQVVYHPTAIQFEVTTAAPFEAGCLDVDDTDARIADGRLVYTDAIFNCANGAAVTNEDGDAGGNAASQAVLGQGVTQTDPQLDANLSAQAVAAMLNAATDVSFGAIAGVSALPASTGTSGTGIWNNGFFVDTDYIGAVDPRARHAWWDGWTVHGGSGSLKAGTFHPLQAEIEAGTLAPAAGPCPAGTPAGVSANLFGAQFPICILDSDITADTTLSNGHVYLVAGTLNVGNGGAQGATAASVSNVTLTLEAGTQIFGDTTAGTAGLVITRGSDVVVQGTAELPVVMSSADDGQIDTTVNDFTGRDEWGGLIIDGFAPVNEGPEVLSEAAPDGVNRFFGGNDPTDDSGSIEYLVITESGQEFRRDEEIQGLTLEGVGSGTEISYVQVHQSGDDGIEWFGGTVNARYVVITGMEDDGLDMDLGYQGGIQFAIVKLANDAGNRAIESDNNGDDFSLAPISTPTIANATLIGDVGAPDATTTGALHREGFGVFMHKVVIADGDGAFEGGCLDVDDTDARITDARLVYTDAIFNCANGAAVTDESEDAGGNTASQALLDQGGITQVDPQLDANLAAQAPAALLPAATDVSFDAIAGVSALPGSTGTSAFGIWNDGFFVDTDYIGAANPKFRHAWWDGWTVHGGSGSLKAGTFHPLQAEIEAGTLAPAAGPCPAGTPAGVSANLFGAQFPICILDSDITADTTLTNGHVYLVAGTLNVGSGGAQGATAASVSNVTLTLEAGTQIFGDTTAGTAGLVITRGSDIVVQGTSALPVVMSSADDGQIDTTVNDFTGRDEWGGLIIDGFAPVNEGPEVLSEAAPDGVNRFFGGNDPTDDSGSIRYLVITESGQEFRRDEEIQGLTLEGVGSGTEISYVQVHQSGDDGIEWFGGTVNARYVVITGMEDDGLDMDLGYQGGIQFAIVKLASDGGNRAIESDNNGDDFSLAPISTPTMANVLLIGNSGAPDATTTGALHREGFGVFMNKIVITDGN